MIYKHNQSRGHRTLRENYLTLYFMTCKLILLDCSVKQLWWRSPHAPYAFSILSPQIA